MYISISLSLSLSRSISRCTSTRSWDIPPWLKRKNIICKGHGLPTQTMPSFVDINSGDTP